ncbi:MULTISPECIES: helix-turn-helix domain-containing protein [Paraburkholderia]|jgi:HTH-type transcriptional regulator/antitoxin HigA|uniref:HTH-type transcriptional regulator / antitoxin HigA n=1 Tax=Paraburkholderia phenazinium TaxID=60549 RepID=A0A1N6H3Z0_9BURK|nr:helix-turn-helix domain-containing protein [Paraburkholderia phenazinium]SIO14521.1 HTH-type transcriptional regulator / antitoxin HigA [Paraburkholderia phenazinium]
MNADRLSGQVPDIVEAWAALQSKVPLKPIRNEQEYEQLTQLANALTNHLHGDADNPLTDLLGVLSALIGGWESRQVVVPSAEPREVLRHLLETHGLKQKDLADIASPTVVSDILAGRRAISKNVAKALAVRFRTDVSVFI